MKWWEIIHSFTFPSSACLSLLYSLCDTPHSSCDTLRYPPVHRCFFFDPWYTTMADLVSPSPNYTTLFLSRYEWSFGRASSFGFGGHATFVCPLIYDFTWHETLRLRFLDVHLYDDDDDDDGAVLFGWVIWFDSFSYPFSFFLFTYLLSLLWCSSNIVLFSESLMSLILLLFI